MGIPSQIKVDHCTLIAARHYPRSEYKRFTAAERQKHWLLMNPGKTPGTGPPRNCHAISGGGRSIALTITGGSTSGQKRSAKDADLHDESDDDASLFAGSKTNSNQEDHRTGNCANVCQK